VVEISTYLSDLYITAYSTVGPESFVIVNKGIQARYILRSFGSDFKIMAMCLGFKNCRLVLRNPRNFVNKN
jgi:hypothetical protein